MRKEVLPHEHRLYEHDWVFTRELLKSGELAADVVRIYAGDAADRIAHDAKQIVNAMATRFDRNEALDKARTAVLEHKGIDAVAARRRIGDAAIQAGRYPF